jgi:hypothetical protein
MTRKLRGLLSTTLTICVPSTVLGALTGLAVQVGAVPGLHVSDLMVPGATLGALVGAVAGLTYSVLILAAERNTPFEQLRPGRFAIWGGLGMATSVGFLFHNPLVAAAAGLLGAVAAPAMLAIARRATPDASALPPSTESSASIHAPST